eukprot:2628526-Pyramimonas_sp.AAC.1
MSASRCILVHARNWFDGRQKRRCETHGIIGDRGPSYIVDPDAKMGQGQQGSMTSPRALAAWRSP